MTVAPSACTASTVQDFTDWPLKSTVHAPQWLVSQPIWLPVRSSRSRRVWISSSRASTRASTAWPWSASLRAGDGETDGATRHLPRHVGAVFTVTAQVLGRIADRHRRLDGLLD